MPNLHRGEIEALFDGRPLTLCLTLGALAELEATYGDEDMLALANRFAAGRLSARDAIRVLGAGLRGAGHDMADVSVARMQTDGGAAGFVDIVARLLTATFGASHAVPSTSHAVPSTSPAAPVPPGSSIDAATAAGEVAGTRPDPSLGRR